MVDEKEIEAMAEVATFLSEAVVYEKISQDVVFLALGRETSMGKIFAAILTYITDKTKNERLLAKAAIESMRGGENA